MQSLASFTQFSNHSFCDGKRSPAASEVIPIADTLQQMDVDLDIPKKKEIILYCSNTEEQQWMYKNLIQYASIVPPEEVENKCCFPFHSAPHH